MKVENIREAAEREIPGKRLEHTLGVVETAIRLARKFGGDPLKAEIAALLHDYCKAWPMERQRAVLEQCAPGTDLLYYDKELWHAAAAACVVPAALDVTDPEVLDAIRYHTSGREQMSLLDKIVCLADYIEPGRDFPNVHKIRELAESSLEEALIAGFDSTILHLIERRKRIYPLTLAARNALIEELANGPAAQA